MTTMVYIDNDNLQFTKYEKVLTSFFFNRKAFFKIFINEYELSKIDESYKNKHKFIVCNNNGKNSLDISIAIECMKDLMRNRTIHTYAIVSNDSDFIPLCKEVKEYGKTCYLFVDRQPNDAAKDAYDKIINVGDCKREEEKRKHQLRELAKQKLLEEKRRIEKLQVQKAKIIIPKAKNPEDDMKIKVKSLLDEYFLINPNSERISYERIQNLFNRNGIDYNTYYKTLGKFLKKYLPVGYKRSSDGDSYVIKLKMGNIGGNIQMKVKEEEEFVLADEESSNDAYDMKIKVKHLLDEYFVENPGNKLSYNTFIVILQKNDIDYRNEYLKFNNFLKEYLPHNYSTNPSKGLIMKNYGKKESKRIDR